MRSGERAPTRRFLPWTSRRDRLGPLHIRVQRVQYTQCIAMRVALASHIRSTGEPSPDHHTWPKGHVIDFFRLEFVMKPYPSISTKIRPDVPVYVFDKLDGSQIRAEWTPKSGFGNFGSRKRALESSHPWLGEAIALVRDKYEADVHRVQVDDAGASRARDVQDQDPGLASSPA